MCAMGYPRLYDSWVTGGESRKARDKYWYEHKDDPKPKQLDYLYRRNGGEKVSVSIIDNELCAALGLSSGRYYYVLDWVDSISFSLFHGKTIYQVARSSPQDCDIGKIATWLDDNFVLEYQQTLGEIKPGSTFKFTSEYKDNHRHLLLRDEFGEAITDGYNKDDSVVKVLDLDDNMVYDIYLTETVCEVVDPKE